MEEIVHGIVHGVHRAIELHQVHLEATLFEAREELARRLDGDGRVRDPVHRADPRKDDVLTLVGGLEGWWQPAREREGDTHHVVVMNRERDGHDASL